MSANNESVLQSFRQFLQNYQSGGTGVHVPEVSTVQVPDLSSDHMQTVVLRPRTVTDSCFFTDHTISPNDVEPEVFDWIYYHLDYKKCPYPLAFALASIVGRKLGLAATASESHTCEADKSTPAISSNELYSQSLEYLTEFINSWKENPEIAVEIAKEFSWQRFHLSIAAIKNARRKMEDRHVVLHDLNKALALKSAHQYSYYAIFDGHAGVDAASYASAHLHYNLVKTQAFIDGDIPSAFKEAFSITDLHYLERSARENKKSGSTALCAIIQDEAKLFVAWLGDSQAVLVRNGKPIDIMIPHKPELEEERKRIEELGGFVAYVDTWRVNGTLAVSRAIGDPEHKPYISSEPDVVQLAIDSDTDFLILACDGLWDNLTPEEATSLVFEYICQNPLQDMDQITQNVALHLSKASKDDGSSDNITTIVVFFKSLDQLRSTPFTPLTPREKNETNGLNGSHFQFNELEFLQSNAKNPFDCSDQSANWTSESFDEMNNAKYNFEISDSTFSSEADSGRDLKLDSNANPNPFATYDKSFADLNSQNKFDSSVNTYFDNESSLFSDQSSYPKLESDISQTTENHSKAEQQSSHSDSQFNISKVSDISSSLGTQAVTQTDHALCSTPLQISLPSDTTADQFAEESSVSCIANQSLADLTNETPMEAEPSREMNHDLDINATSKQTNEAEAEKSDKLNDNSFNDSMADASFMTAKCGFDDSNPSITFDKSGYQTAVETEMVDDLNDTCETATPKQSPLKLEDVCEQVFADIDAPFNRSNTDSHDHSSETESVDYDKILTDMSAITQRVKDDYSMDQNYDSAENNISEPLAKDKEECVSESTQGMTQESLISSNADIADINAVPALSQCADAVDETQHEGLVFTPDNDVSQGLLLQTEDMNEIEKEELKLESQVTQDCEVPSEQKDEEIESATEVKPVVEEIEPNRQNETIIDDQQDLIQELRPEIENLNELKDEPIVSQVKDSSQDVTDFVNKNIESPTQEVRNDIEESVELNGFSKQEENIEELNPETNMESSSEPNLEHQPELKLERQPEVNSEPQPEPMPQTEQELERESWPESEQEAHLEFEQEPGPEPYTESQPQSLLFSESELTLELAQQSAEIIEKLEEQPEQVEEVNENIEELKDEPVVDQAEEEGISETMQGTTQESLISSNADIADTNAIPTLSQCTDEKDETQLEELVIPDNDGQGLLLQTEDINEIEKEDLKPESQVIEDKDEPSNGPEEQQIQIVTEVQVVKQFAEQIELIENTETIDDGQQDLIQEYREEVKGNTNGPIGEPKDEPKEEPKDEPKEEPKDEPKEEPKDEPKEEPKEEPKDEPIVNQESVQNANEFLNEDIEVLTQQVTKDVDESIELMGVPEQDEKIEELKTEKVTEGPEEPSKEDQEIEIKTEIKEVSEEMEPNRQNETTIDGQQDLIQELREEVKETIKELKDEPIIGKVEEPIKEVTDVVNEKTETQTQDVTKDIEESIEKNGASKPDEKIEEAKQTPTQVETKTTAIEKASKPTQKVSATAKRTFPSKANTTAPAKTVSKTLTQKTTAPTSRAPTAKTNALITKTTTRTTTTKPATSRATGNTNSLASTTTTRTTPTTTTTTSRAGVHGVASARTAAQTKTTRQVTTRPTLGATTKTATSTVRTAAPKPAEVKPKVTRQQITSTTSRLTSSRPGSATPSLVNTNGSAAGARSAPLISRAKKPATATASSAPTARNTGVSSSARTAPSASAPKPRPQTTMNGTKPAAAPKMTAVSRVNTGRTVASTANKAPAPVASKPASTASPTSPRGMASSQSRATANDKLKVTNSLKQELEDAMSQPVPPMPENND